MTARCDICLEKNCNKHCDCDVCSKKASCPKYLHPVIRITTKCTQSCHHCCFSCSPKCDEMMSIETANDIANFITNNNIEYAEIMGGEFYMNPLWKQIIEIIVPKLKVVRLVTNGDWATTEKVPKILSQFKNIFVAISNDRWHTNKHVKNAKKLCEKYKIKHEIADEERTKESSIVPVGRSALGFSSLYGMFSCYCHNPQRQYSFLIDEKGIIYKCGFGSWNYAKVKEYIDGGFAARFKEFNLKFYDVFISSCNSCRRAYEHRGIHKEKP